MEKTNVMRILDQKKIKYEGISYECDEFHDGLEIALKLDENPSFVYKTIVLISPQRKNYVCMLPVDKELDLKKCARAVNEKSLDLLPLKEVLPTTGYVRGGCSPIGMKKQFKTIIQNGYINEYIIFSGGKIGFQVKMNYNDLKRVIPLIEADIIKGE